MATNRYSAFAPIGLKFHNNQPQVVVRNLTAAARVLIQDWPLDDGEDYVIAVKACADALIGEISLEEFREILLSAAIEAGISALSVVSDQALRDGSGKPHADHQEPRFELGPYSR